MMRDKPIVLVAVLVKQKGALLHYWLESLSDWDYPKNRMIIYIRENNSSDDSEEILKSWADANRAQYLKIIEDYSDLDVPVENWGIHQWNETRFAALGRIREASVKAALNNDADFYFVSDVDNFLLPLTLSKLVDNNLPIVAPLLRYATSEGEEMWAPYSNYHHEIDDHGYLQVDAAYHRVLNQEVKGFIECPVVHCTYLIRRDVLPFMKYVQDNQKTDRHEYVTFSNNCRDLKIPQYLDNEMVYGCLTLSENLEAVKKWMTVLSESEGTNGLTWQQNLLS